MESKLDKLENLRIPKLTRKEKIRTKRNTNTLYALMTSPAKNCSVMKCAKLVNKNRHIYVTLECMRKSMNVKPLHNTRSLQSTRRGLIQTKYWSDDHWEDRMGADAGNIGLMNKEYVWHTGRSMQMGA